MENMYIAIAVLVHRLTEFKHNKFIECKSNQYEIGEERKLPSLEQRSGTTSLRVQRFFFHKIQIGTANQENLSG